MRSQCVFFFLLFFAVGQVFAQRPDREFELITFHNLDPVYHVANYDLEMDNGEFDGFNNFVSAAGYIPLVTNTAIIELFYRQNTYEPTGTYIQKRSRETGELLWRRYIGYPLDEQQILGRIAKINNDGDVDLLCQVKCDPYDPVTPLLGRTNMALYEVTLDFEDGQVLQEVDYVCNDSLYIQTNFDGFYPLRASRFFAINDTFNFTQSEWGGTKWRTALFKVKSGFSIEEIDSTSFPTKYQCYDDLPIFFNDSTRIMFESNCETKQVELTFLDSRFEVLQTIVSDSLSSSLQELTFKWFDPVAKCLLFENVVSFETRQVELLVVNLQGELMRSVKVPVEYSRSYDILEWSGVDSLYLIARRYIDPENVPRYVTHDLLKYEVLNNVFKVHKTFAGIDSSRFITRVDVVHEDEEYYYLSLFEASLLPDSGERDRRAQATTLMKISREQLLGSISTTGELLTETYTVYPNPTSGVVFLDAAVKPLAIKVYDAGGKLISERQTPDRQIDLTGARTGVYLLQLIFEESIQWVRVVKQ